MTDLTPVVPEGRQLIQGYGDSRFRISGVVHEGSVIVFVDTTIAWQVEDYGDLRADLFQPILDRATEIDLLIIGCGTTFRPLPGALAQKFVEENIAVETMDTGAACRTYNLLLSDGRRVAAALIAVDRDSSKE